MRSATAGLVLALLAGACGGGGGPHRDAAGIDSGLFDGAVDTGPRRDTGPPMDAGPGCVTALPVDLLWVIDNSNSMAREQSNLAINFPRLLDVLTTPPDEDGDGEPDYPPVEDLQVGVVSTDLGVGPYTVSSCTAMGDDGVLISSARGPDPACSGVTIGPPPWLTFMTGDDAMAVGQEFSCIARLGTGGCGLEQQLESSLRALTDRSAAGQPNEGFLREGSLLAVVWVTDEDDCSAADETVFDPMDTEPYGVRCANHPELLHPTSRYVSGLMGLRSDGNVVVAAITGVPRDLVDVPDLIDYDALLADDRMQYTPDATGAVLEPACEVMGLAHADPARRIVEVVKPFAERHAGIVQSICSEDFGPAIEAIAKLIASRLCGPII